MWTFVRRVCGHVGPLCVDLCVDLCIDMCLRMRACRCTDCEDVFVGADVGVDMCIMSIDMRGHVCVDMCVWKFVCGHVCADICV